MYACVFLIVRLFFFKCVHVQNTFWISDEEVIVVEGKVNIFFCYPQTNVYMYYTEAKCNQERSHRVIFFILDFYFGLAEKEKKSMEKKRNKIFFWLDFYILCLDGII